MNVMIHKVHSLGIAIAMSMLVAGTATAAELTTDAQALSENLRLTSDPQPGTCKRAYEAIVGPSAPSAQAMWTQMVAAKYGTKWAHWVGAQNKAVIPLASGSGTQFQARAQPCFHQPVL